MTEKRFYLNEREGGILKILDLKEDNETIYHTATKSDMKRVVELLNELNDANEFLRKDNLKIYGLLGSIRTLLQNNKTKEAIQKINTLEKEITQ